MNKVELAIERLRAFEPPEGYYLAFSGGKDSVALYALAQQAGVKFDAHYNITTADPPELVQFIRTQFPAVKREPPEETMWEIVRRKGLPTRRARFCCALLKERGGEGRRVLTGIRHDESRNRAGRALVEQCRTTPGKISVHPLLDWVTDDVWAFHRKQGLPHCSLYDEGFKRLGCVLCPMATYDETLLQLERWPKIADAWERAATVFWQRHTPGAARFASGEEFWMWWLTRMSVDDFQNNR